MKLFFTLLIPLAIALLTVTGCYTILKHPDVQENYTSHDYQQDCLSCHPDYHDYPYGYFYGNYPSYWLSNSRWGHYYAYPWWWDYYWYDYKDQNYDEGGGAPAEQGEKVVRRDALRPPYSNSSGVSNIHRSGDQPPTDQSGNVGSKPSTPDSSPDGKKNTKDTKKQDNKEAKKEPRRGGGGPR